MEISLEDRKLFAESVAAISYLEALAATSAPGCWWFESAEGMATVIEGAKRQAATCRAFVMCPYGQAELDTKPGAATAAFDALAAADKLVADLTAKLAGT